MDSNKTDKYIALGENIRRLRKSKNFSQEQLAKALDISVATLSSYETGKTAPPLAISIKIAETFNTSISHILFRNDDPEFPY